ncbi:type II toxin-antitoxin system death-on-curing family toxin [Nakamurella sp. A5-74]|uniref:Type II toxin-antitoxin system death-on-curing family toxin n=1 Tax=Nakamurella sp. A5-74 TaxID=3158264 RepID=A0AAU8DSX0_9ACTN
MTDPEPEFLTDDEAFAIVDKLGFHIRDVGLLQSALARPRTTVFGDDAYPDLATKAAAMFESLVRNHPLLDGNKRLAVVLTWTFLAINGAELAHTEDEAYDFVIAAASGELSLQDMRSWFDEHLRRA